MNIFQAEFFQRALIAAFLISLVASLLGVFVILRGMAFFSDAIAHSSFTGVALGLLLGIEPLWTVFAVAIIVAALLPIVSRLSNLSQDSTIGILYALSVSVGLLIAGLLPQGLRGIESYLFGDILAISRADLFVFSGFAIIAVLLFILLFRALLLITFDPEVAKVLGVRTIPVEILFTVILGLAVAMAVKLIGAILLPVLFIVPPAAGKTMSRSLKGMVISSVLVGVVSALGGVLLSVIINAPTGPTIAALGVLIFFLCLIFRRL